MNQHKITAPDKGSENLLEAGKLLNAIDVSPSHVLDAVLRTHSAVESLFREYLETSDFVPSEIRSQAGDFHEMSFPDLVRAMNAYGKPTLSEQESEILKLNQVRNQRAHPSGTTTTRSEAIAFLALGEELYQYYSDYKPQTTSFMNAKTNLANFPPGENGKTPIERPDPELVSFGKWPSSRLSDNISGIKATEKDLIVWFKENRFVKPKNKIRPGLWECDRYAIVHRGTVIWQIKIDGIECGQKNKQYWSVNANLSLKMNLRDDADISQIALTYNSELEHLKMLIKEKLSAIMADVQPDILEKAQNPIGKTLKQEISNSESCFKFGEITLVLKSPKYQEETVQDFVEDAARKKQLRDDKHIGAIEEAKWKRQFRRESLAKLENLSLNKKELELATKFTNSINGKEKAFVAYQASKSDAALRAFIESVFGLEQYEKADERSRKNFEQIAKIWTEAFNRNNPGGFGGPIFNNNK